ncbi:MAG: helix-turn-helix transcriptional regulator [Pyrinomonadaceae bacterium]
MRCVPVITTSKQAKILSRFIYQVAEVAAETLTAFVDEEKPIEKVLLPVSHENRLLNKRELAARLGVSVRSLDNLISDGLKPVRIGKRVLFDYEKVLLWIEDQEIISRRKKNLRMVG